jgi:hypothetical protein
MSTKLGRLRQQACLRQGQLCCYCNQLMCTEDPGSFARRHNLTLAEAKQRRCTAEHLLARRDGGKTTLDNIAAACYRCNCRRHARRRSLSPAAYRAHVRQRIEAAKWWPQS